MKQICGSSKSHKPDIRSTLNTNLDYSDYELGNKINEAFISVMKDYSPLSEDVCVCKDDDEPIHVTVTSVAKKLRKISSSRASGPDNLPNWVLKVYADILAPAVLNSSFRDCRVPRAWKLADVPPIPKSSRIMDFNKDLRPISLTSTR